MCAVPSFADVLLVLIAASVLIAWWSRWLVRTRDVPRWTRWIGPGLLASTALTTIASLWTLHRAYATASDEEAGNKATALASNMSTALNLVAVGCAVALGAGLVLAIQTARARRRAV
jgi:hypothetical protein